MFGRPAAKGSTRTLRVVAVALFALLLSLAAVALASREANGAGEVPRGFTQARLATGLSEPTTMAMAPDGRIFVAEQRGTLRVIKDGRLLPDPAIDLSQRIDDEGERGLLGIAFDPDFATNGWIYLFYTRRATTMNAAFNRVSRFTVNGDRLDVASERGVIRLEDLSERTNHNGGAMHFGRDGRLYVAVGENSERENSQSLQNRLGKMLRVNKNGTIPKDNPFYDRAQGENRAIWALGLRNPYTFAVQPGSGRIYINDVGAQTWEEINRGAAGANYGWPVHEGPESDRRYTAPIFAYRHGTNSGCAITGGAFYNPRTVTFPGGFVGDYLFADYCEGYVRRFDPATGSVSGFMTNIDRPVSLMVSPAGNLYYIERATGSVYKVSHPN